MYTGKKCGDPTVNMIRALAYDPSGIIYFKTNITEEYAQLPQRIGKKPTRRSTSPITSGENTNFKK